MTRRRAASSPIKALSRATTGVVISGFVAAAIVSCGNGGNSSRPFVSVDLSGDPICIESSLATVEVDRARFRIAVRSRATVELFTQQAGSEALFYERGYGRHALTAVRDAQPLA